jgi:hypothetical protein
MRGHLDKGLFALGPIVKSGGVEVSPVRPDERVSHRIDSDPIEQSLIAQRTVQFSPQNRLKIDYLFRSIVKHNAQGVWSDDLKIPDAAYLVHHSQPPVF